MPDPQRDNDIPDQAAIHANATRSYQHAMLREIYEQPAALLRTAEHYIGSGKLNAEAFAPVHAALANRRRLVVAASGSSRHAGLAGEIMLEDLAGLIVDVEYASEYVYRSTHTLEDPGAIVLSQSGETADTLAALREATARGVPTVAITNNPDSTMSREANASIPTYAGVEKAIPATKSFTTQLLVLNCLTLSLARIRGRMTVHTVEAHAEELLRLPALLEAALPVWELAIRQVAQDVADASTFLYLGRGIHYAIAREGALKLKESAYVQAEGYPTGELKHGPNALVNAQAPLVVLATHDPGDPDSVLRYRKTLQLMSDMKEQGATILSLANQGDAEAAALSRSAIFVPTVSDHLLPILEVVPLQLLAYSLAILKGIDVDRPRNLVKAVVAE
jgi:glucosamine--fructose-6-phosphate aminotransferase (isomerizing)